MVEIINPKGLKNAKNPTMRAIYSSVVIILFSCWGSFLEDCFILLLFLLGFDLNAKNNCRPPRRIYAIARTFGKKAGPVRLAPSCPAGKEGVMRSIVTAIIMQTIPTVCSRVTFKWNSSLKKNSRRKDRILPPHTINYSNYFFK